MTQRDRAHARVAHLIAGGTLLASGPWHGRDGEPGRHAEMVTHLWHVGPDRFVADHDWHITTPHQTQQEAHRADTAREIYDLLPEKHAPFPKWARARGPR